MEFGQLETVGIGKGGGSARTRVFDIIRKRGILPTRGDHHRRSFDIVARVEAYPGLNGTQAIIDSPFWELLSLAPHDIDETSKFVEQCLEQLNLTRLSCSDSIDWMWISGDEPENVSLRSSGSTTYEKALRRATKNITLGLDLIALFGALYREACLDFCLDNAEVAGIFFKLALEEYFGEAWTGQAGAVLSDIAINRILHGRINYVPIEGAASELNEFGTVSQRHIASKCDPSYLHYCTNKSEVTLALRLYLMAMATPSDLKKFSPPPNANDRIAIAEIRKRMKS